MILLFWPIGWATFQDGDHTAELFIAGLAVPLAIATSMWSALVQAQGQLKTLAKTQVVSAVAGLLVGLPLIYHFGSKGSIQHPPGCISARFRHLAGRPAALPAVGTSGRP